MTSSLPDTSDDLRQYVEARMREPNRPPDADVIYADGYEAGQREAFRSVLAVIDGKDPWWRTWLESDAKSENQRED